MDEDTEATLPIVKYHSSLAISPCDVRWKIYVNMLILKGMLLFCDIDEKGFRIEKSVACILCCMYYLCYGSPMFLCMKSYPGKGLYNDWKLVKLIHLRLVTQYPGKHAQVPNGYCLYHVKFRTLSKSKHYWAAMLVMQIFSPKQSLIIV